MKIKVELTDGRLKVRKYVAPALCRMVDDGRYCLTGVCYATEEEAIDDLKEEYVRWLIDECPIEIEN